MQIQQEADVVVLAVPGPTLDASNAKTIKSKIGPVVEAATKLVVDMTAVRFMDSSGLGDGRRFATVDCEGRRDEDRVLDGGSFVIRAGSRAEAGGYLHTREEALASFRK
jgi:STAS domain